MIDTENLQQDTQVVPEINLQAAQPIDEVASRQSPSVPGEPAPKEEAKASEPEGFQARNFRELKEAAKRERAEKEALAREVQKLKELMEAQQQPRATQESDDFEIGNDDIAEGKHLKKIKSSQQKEREERLRLQQEINNLRIEREIEREIPDFYQIVTKENVEAFAMMDPDMAEVIGKYPDLKKAAKATYSAIVKNGIHKMHEYDTQKELIKQNMSKPKPTPEGTQSGGTSALSRATESYSGDLTDEMKKMYYQEMKKAQRGR